MPGDTLFKSMKLSFTWCYLLECRDGYLLIDTSYPGCFAPFRKNLERLGLPLSEIRYVLLTHHHDDHAGFAAELVRHSGCRVIVHQQALEPLRQGCSQETMRPFNRRVELLFGLFALFHRRFTFPPLFTGADDMVLTGDDETLLPRLGIAGKILATPGHSRDSLSVVLDDGRAFVGDVAMNFLRLTGVGHWPIYVEDLGEVASSWRKILDHGATSIYPSHGRPFAARELRP